MLSQTVIGTFLVLPDTAVGHMAAIYWCFFGSATRYDVGPSFFHRGHHTGNTFSQETTHGENDSGSRGKPAQAYA